MPIVNSILLVFCGGLLGWGTVSEAGDLRSQIYEGVAEDGGIQDRCLNTEIPVFIKKVDEGVYFVRVKNRFAGQVRADSYGEARNIGCEKKTGLVLFDGSE